MIVCSAVGAGVYASALRNDFAYDDLGVIAENESIHTLETIPGAMVEPYWPGPFGEQLALWRPATTALFGIEWVVFGGRPLGFHLVSVLLHAAATGLVVLLLARLIPLSGAFLGGLLFAVHPVHTEAVANVVGQSEIVVAALYMMACLVHLETPATERHGPRRLASIWLLFALAFSFKEMAVTLPGVLFLLDGARIDFAPKDLGDYVRRRWVLYGGLAVTTVLILFGRYLVLGSVARPFAPLGAEILEEVPRIWTVAGLWPDYVRLLFFPADLSSDYAPAVTSILYGWSAENLVGLGVAMAFLGLAWATWRRSPPLGSGSGSSRALGFGVLWFVITISPVSNFFFLAGVLISERSFYLPSVGFALAAGWASARLVAERRTLGWAATAVAVALMGYRTWTRNPDWRNSSTVFGVLIEDHPESGRAQWALGDTYYQRGDTTEALRAMRFAVGLLGTEYPLLISIGKRLSESGFPEQAELLFRIAWRSAPEFDHAPALLGMALDQQGRFEEAEEVARVVLEREEDVDPLVPQVLALSLAGQGRYGEAVQPTLEAIRLGRDSADQWSWLAQLYLAVGDRARAEEALDSARAKTPTEDQIRQIGSIRARLMGDTAASESAKSLQNPRRNPPK